MITIINNFIVSYLPYAWCFEYITLNTYININVTFVSVIIRNSIFWQELVLLEKTIQYFPPFAINAIGCDTTDRIESMEARKDKRVKKARSIPTIQ